MTNAHAKALFLVKRLKIRDDPKEQAKERFLDQVYKMAMDEHRLPTSKFKIKYHLLKY